MEDLEQELNQSCGCCEQCDCGEDCNCTEDNKCCDDCKCCENAENTECNCECEHSNELSEDSEKVENKTDEVETDENCQPESEIEEQNCEEVEDDDKCQCGCGENVEEETTADAYFKQLLSLRAEFDNYRKRTQSDISKAYSNGFNQAISEFLPALDSFKMATEYITDANTLMGIQYIEKGILATLEKMGIQTIDTTGKFDPELHQAIDSELSAEHESVDIIKECFKGFKMGDKIIRYAQVVVAK